MRIYDGNEPGRDWKNLITLENDGIDWTVYTRMTDPEHRWMSVKVTALRGAPVKANYWVSWDREKNKFGGRTTDAGLLKKNRPALCNLLNEFFVENRFVRLW